MKSDEGLLEELKEATEGLTFMSESDYPLQVIRWERIDEITHDFLRAQTDAPAGTEVVTESVEEFFRASMSEERGTAKQYRSLVGLLKDNLEDVRVYRVGEISIPVYVIGRHESGSWIGISTRVVET